MMRKEKGEIGSGQRTTWIQVLAHDGRAAGHGGRWRHRPITDRGRPG